MQQVKGSVINSLILGRNHFCSLCFKTVADSAVHIEDKVVIKKHDNTQVEVYMIDILTEIFGPENDFEVLQKCFELHITDQLSIFNAVCNQCSSGAINSYKFYTKCKYNSQKLGQIIYGITNGAKLLSQPNYKGVKAGFISINTDNFEYSAYHSKSTASTGALAYHKFQNLRYKTKITNKHAVKTIPRITKLKRTNEELKILRLKLVRLNPKVLNKQKVFVCPCCDQFFTQRHIMHLHYQSKHHSERKCFALVN